MSTVTHNVSHITGNMSHITRNTLHFTFLFDSRHLVDLVLAGGEARLDVSVCVAGRPYLAVVDAGEPADVRQDGVHAVEAAAAANLGKSVLPSDLGHECETSVRAYGKQNNKSDFSSNIFGSYSQYF